MPLLLCLVIMGSVAAPQDRKGNGNPSRSVGDQLFIYQGPFDSLGTVDEIAQLAGLHDYVVFTHGFYLDGSGWTNGHCLDVNYSKMPELMAKVRENNPEVRIFVYVPATADHPNGCWPQPSVQMSECPAGNCADFKTWTNLWLNLKLEHDSISIDGVFVDMVHPALIGTGVRDSVFSYVKSRGKLIMANALSDTLGLKFAAASPFLQPEDYVFIEGYYLLAGYPNSQTEAMNLHLQEMNIHWAALATETYSSAITCNSENMKDAYNMFRQYEGSAFAYQSADLGTQSGTWVFCPNDEVPTSVSSRGVQIISQDVLLEQNYPNPFNPATTIRYEIPVGTNGHTSLRVFDVLGREVATLVNGVEEPGYKSVTWDATGVASGLYFYRLQVAGPSTNSAPRAEQAASPVERSRGFVQTRKLLLLR